MIVTRVLFATVLAGSALAAGASQAAVLYDNGASTYDSVSYGLTGGNYAEDSFTVGADATVMGVDFVAWNYPTYRTTSKIDWAIYSGTPKTYALPGPLLESGTSAVTSAFILDNAKGFAVNTDTFAIPALALSSGSYTLVLGTAYDNSGDPNEADSSVSWDVNYGPSTAVGHTNFAGDGYGSSNSFQILGSVSSAPEPATWALMLVGLGGLGAVLRRSRERVIAV